MNLLKNILFQVFKFVLNAKVQDEKNTKLIEKNIYYTSLAFGNYLIFICLKQSKGRTILYM